MKEIVIQYGNPPVVVTEMLGDIPFPAGSQKVLHDVEGEAIIRALQRCEGVFAQTAKILGVSRQSLQNKMDAHRIEVVGKPSKRK